MNKIKDKYRAAKQSFKQHSQLILWFAVYTAFSNYTSAQEISAKSSSSKTEYLIGDKIEVLLDIKMPPDFRVVWHKNVPDTNHLELVDSIKHDSFFVNKTIELKYYVSLASFDSGKAMYPAQEFIFHKKGDTTEYKINTEAIVFNIKIITVDTKKDIKPIIDPIEPGIDFLTYLIYIFLGLLAVTFVVLIYVYWKKKKRRPESELSMIQHPKKPPWEYAIENLMELQHSNLSSRDVKAYFIALSNIIRHYITEMTLINALEITTEELLTDLNKKIESQEIIAGASYLLNLADSVKFAKYHPNQSDNEEAMQKAITLVRSLQSIIAPEQNPSAV